MINRRAWFGGPAPWPRWEITVEGFEKNGLKLKTVEYSAQHVVTPQTQVKDFFSATVAKSVMSQRCTTCHSIDTPELIEEHHATNGVGGVPASSVTRDDSIVTAGEEINTCSNCHEAGLPADFHERRWATPTPEQDIHWGSIINADPSVWPLEICDRMVSNLGTAAKREEHFHEDARLFWAVGDGVTPFGDQLPTSHPKDYDLFLDHFDVWNDAGAPCPLPEPGTFAGLLSAGGWLVMLNRRRRRSE